MGELQWVLCPDVTYAVGVLGRLMRRRLGEVASQAKAIPSYPRDTADDATADDGLQFNRALGSTRSEEHVEAYADASFAPAPEQYKSVHGTITIVLVAGCPILWSSSRQPFITPSTS